MPLKLVPVTALPWQLAQPDVMPAWLYLLFVKKVALVSPIFAKPEGTVW